MRLPRFFPHSALYLLCIAFAAQGATVSTRITYLSGETIYLEAGRADKIDTTCIGDVWRDGSVIATLAVFAAAEHSSSAHITAQTASPLVGDYVTFALSDSGLQNTAPELATSDKQLLSQNNTPSVAETKPSSRRNLKAKRNRLTGRIAVQSYFQDDHQTQTGDLMQPAILTRLKLTSIFGSGFDFNFKMRNRKQVYLHEDEAGKSSTWDHRYYEAQLTNTNSDSPWKFQAGRILVGSIGGIGYLDGAYLQYQLMDKWSVGSFAGMQPDLTTTAFQSDTRKTGACIIWSPENSGARSLSMTTALAGEYENTEISREFIYHQFSANLNSGLSVYESADLNINRGWKSNAEHSALTLANVIFNARYQATKSLAASLGFDGHANYRTWDTKETPDSLFDDAMREGARAGLECQLPYGIRCDLRETLRREPSTDKLFASTSASAMTHRLLGGRAGATMRYDQFNNQFTSGIQQSAALAWTTPLHGELTLQVGNTAYKYRTTDTKSNSNWWRSTLDFALGHHLYGSTSFENNLGSSENVSRVFTELGFRL